MAITSAVTGVFSATTTWVGGVVPTFTTDVIIAAPHTVTKDTVATTVSNDCAALQINGTLAIASSNGIQFTGAPTGSGTLEMRDTSKIYFAQPSTDYTINWTFDVQGTAAGVSGCYLGFAVGGRLIRIAGSADASTVGPQLLKNCEIDGNNDTLPLQWRSFTFVDNIISADIHNFNTATIVNYSANLNFMRLFDCYIYDGGNGFGGGDGIVWVYGGKVGIDRSGANNAVSRVVRPTDPGSVVKFYGTEFNYSSEFASVGGFSDLPYVVRAQGFDGDPHKWYIDSGLGNSQLATDGATEVWQHQATVYNTVKGGIFDIPFPVDSGDNVTASIKLNLTAGYSGSTGDLLLRLDPGNQWGMEEEKEPNYGSEGTYQTVTFTAGVVGNTGKQGTMLLHIANSNDGAPVYFKDLALS